MNCGQNEPGSARGPFDAARSVMLLANPVSQLGRGEQVARMVAETMKARLSPRTAFRLVFTQHEGHAVQIASSLHDVDVLVVLGGDGILNETVNGLMRLDRADRPALGLVPVGSGNDFARTAGMSFHPERATNQLFSACSTPLDLGCCNGRYFIETLSFGLDAAIALDTVRRRERMDSTGLALYVASSWYQLRHGRVVYRYSASVDDGPPVSGDMLLFAVQMGPTYGSGFRICPDAHVDDGLLDVCIAHPRISLPGAVGIFALAKFGRHTRVRHLEMFRAHRLHVEFDCRPACQVDGEPMHDTVFDVDVTSDELDVLLASDRALAGGR
ncbi:MAG: diacylglycerol/lipid kinase family protein [Coriobacteriales bacterium]